MVLPARARALRALREQQGAVDRPFPRPAVLVGNNNADDGHEQHEQEREQQLAEEGAAAAQAISPQPQQSERTRSRARPHARSGDQSAQADASNLFGDSWREFSHDTAAGRLLHRLYTRKHNKPLVRYPKVRVRRSGAEGSGPAEDRPAWSNLQPAAADPRAGRERRERQRRVEAPRPRPAGAAPRRAAPIDMALRRKPRERIDAEAAAEELPSRPLPRKPVSTEMEKRRLALRFQFGGGKALPETGTLQPLAGQVPLALLTGDASRDIQKRRLRAAREASERAASERAGLEREFDACSRDVERLTSHLEAAQASHGANRKVAKLREELQGRLMDMQSLDETLEAMR